MIHQQLQCMSCLMRFWSPFFKNLLTYVQFLLLNVEIEFSRCVSFRTTCHQGQYFLITNLGCYPCENIIRCIWFNEYLPLRARMSENRRSYTCLYVVSKCSFLSFQPDKRLIPFFHHCQRFHYSWIILHKRPIIKVKIWKISNLEDIVQPFIGRLHLPGPILCGFHFVHIHGNLFGWYNYPQIFHCLLMEIAFFLVQIQPCFQQPFHNTFHMSMMILHKLTVDENTVKIRGSETMQRFSDGIIDIWWEISSRICCSEMH